MELLTLTCLWIIWCTLHSALISRTLDSRFRAHLGEKYRYHRVVYNLVALLTLMPVLWYSHSIRGETFFAWQGAWRPVQFLLAASAVALFAGGGKHYDLKQFLGLRQISEPRSGKGLTATGQLDTSGILGVVRHPWYTGGILILWARPLDRSVLVTNTILTAYLVVGAFLEEKKLVAEFGGEYRDYQKRVPMLVPRPGRRRY